MFWKKNKQSVDSKLIQGMILLNDTLLFDAERFQKDIEKNTKFKSGKLTVDGNACSVTIDKETFAIGSMPVPAPVEEIERIADQTSYWENEMNRMRQHQRHLIVSMLPGSSDTIKRYRIFTSVVCSVLRTHNTAGVYMGGQRLLIPSEGYLDEAAGMSKDWFPLYLWINFGFVENESGRKSAYTYGLREFDKTEMEIIESSREGYK